MAWSNVRTLIEGWMNASPVKFYSTVNEEQEPADAVWSTVLWGVGQGNIISYCRSREELNNFNVVVYGDAGKGWSAVLTAVEQIRDHLMAQTDPADKLHIMNYGTPIEFTGGSANSWYGVELNFEYVIFS